MSKDVALTSARTDAPLSADQISKLAAARAWIELNFHVGITLAEIAETAGLSEFHFQRMFRRHYGKTPKQVTIELRVAEVQRLALGGASLKDAARAAGCAHSSHMTAQFKRLVGTTPRAWLRVARGAR